MLFGRAGSYPHACSHAKIRMNTPRTTAERGLRYLTDSTARDWFTSWEISVTIKTAFGPGLTCTLAVGRKQIPRWAAWP